MSTDEQLYDELVHYGKMGMHWGHRSASSVSPSKSISGKKNVAKGKASVKKTLAKEGKNSRTPAEKKARRQIAAARVAIVLGLIGLRVATSLMYADSMGYSYVDPNPERLV